MNRIEKFISLKNHAYLGKSFKKLKTSDYELCLSFLKSNDKIDKVKFELLINRLFLDKEKPKNWKIISELLSCANV